MSAQMKKSISEFNEFLSSINMDVFICHASYEDRSKSIPKLIGESSRKSYVFFNANLHKSIDNNKEEILNYLGRATSSEKALNIHRPIDSADMMINVLSFLEDDPTKNILIDISTFTHEALVIFLKILSLNFGKRKNIYLMYNSAAEYDPGKAAEEKWLSEGIKEVRSILGFSGEIIPSKKNHLILMVGYETERAEELIDLYEPSLLTLGYGGEDTSVSKNVFEDNLVIYSNLRARYGDVHEFSFSCQNSIDACDSIEKEIDDTYNTIIAPLNNKVSTIGAALLAMKNEEVQLVYAEPEKYNVHNYSSPSEDYYVINYLDILSCSGVVPN